MIDTQTPGGGDTAAAHAACVSIGGITFRIVSDDRRLTSPPYDARNSFGGDPRRADVVVRAEWSDTPLAPRGHIVFDSGGTWRLLESDGDFVFTFQSSVGKPVPYKTARFDPTFATGTIQLYREHFERNASGALYPLQFPLDELVMVHLLAQGRGMEIHGCGLVDEARRAYVFAGQSGAGKSTMARLWRDHPGITLLSDERVIVRTDGDRLIVYGTPWHGDAMLASPASGELAGVFFLKHHPTHAVMPATEPLAAARLFACAFLPFHDANGVNNTAAAAARIARAVPCHELRFAPERSVVAMLTARMA